MCRMQPSLARADSPAIATFEADLRARLQNQPSVEQAARVFARGLYETFDHCVLARVYLTVPYRDLPERNRAFARDLVAAQHSGNRLREETVVLSLFGTWGREAQWCDRRNSKGHVGIPLIDASFVSGIPMVARLFEELGVGNFEWTLSRGDELVRKLMGGFNGVFYVPDAATARDKEGRFIIPAQDFVAQYGVKTVFGMGGAYLGGALAACIVFAGEHMPRQQAERFAGLVTPFKAATAQLVRAKQYFDAG
jgi:hypothetical protein